MQRLVERKSEALVCCAFAKQAVEIQLCCTAWQCMHTCRSEVQSAVYMDLQLCSGISCVAGPAVRMEPREWSCVSV